MPAKRLGGSVYSIETTEKIWYDPGRANEENQERGHQFDRTDVVLSVTNLRHANAPAVIP